MQTIDSKSEILTKVLRTFDLDNKNIITIEKIINGNYSGQYTIKSKTKKFFSVKYSTLAAYEVKTDFNGDKIVKIEYPVFSMLSQALDYAKMVKKDRYKQK